MGKRKRLKEAEVIAFDDGRMNYYYSPWQVTGETIRSSKLNDYLDIWNIRFSSLQWFSQKGPNNGIAGVKIWGANWEIQEMIDLYSPTKDNQIELIKSWDFEPDVYTITILNTGEKNPEGIGNDLVHAYFKIS